MKKYTKEYCKQNKVAIIVNSSEEVIQVAKIFGNYHERNGWWSYFYNDFRYKNHCISAEYKCGHSPKEYYEAQKEYEVITFQQFIQDNEEFVLPRAWKVKVTEENRDILNHYRKNIAKYSYNSDISYHYMVYNGSGDSGQTEGYIEITYDQFCKYILKKETNMKEQFPKDDFGVIVEDKGREIIEYLVNKGFINPRYMGFSGAKTFYFVQKDSNIIENLSENPTSKTYTLEQLKQLDMEKEIIGYKLIKRIYIEAVKKIISTMKDEVVTDKGGIALLKEAGVLDIWFEKIYAPEKPVEVMVDMGSFKLKVTKDGIFHKTEDITKFVEELHNTYTKLPSKFGSYDCIVDEITFKKTGCENNTTKASQWVTSYQEYLKLKN